MKLHIRLSTAIYLLFVVYTLAGVACTSSSETNQAEDEKTARADTPGDLPCKRETAKPIVEKSIYPNSVFELQPDHLSGIERVDLDNGDHLIIHNYGCESYVLTFRFETSRFQNDTSNIPFWYKRTVSLMSEISAGMHPPFDISAGINRVISEIEKDVENGFQGLRFRKQMDVGDTLIGEHVTIDPVQQLTGKKYAIEITFVKKSK